jgi:hypothetical protein
MVPPRAPSFARSLRSHRLLPASGCSVAAAHVGRGGGHHEYEINSTNEPSGSRK